jgi:hypothetical protein
MQRRLLLLCVACAVLGATSVSAQTKWFKFSKAFIDSHYPADSAIGEVKASTVAPAKNVHRVSCGGNDGELHIGIEGKDIEGADAGHPFSAPADQASSDFGLVAEPVNLTSSTKKAAAALAGNAASFKGYFRLWNEGHDVTKIEPSNPHHVLELHPAWAFDGAGKHFDDPTSVHSMQAAQGKVFSGYGASKFRPLLDDLSQQAWLHVYEEDTYVYVELPTASNFYQLPVTLSDAHQVTGGVEAVADVFSDAAHQNLVLSGLRVVANDGSRLADRLTAGDDLPFLLGIFSINLRKAMALAAGHSGSDQAVFAPSALEFFAYGVPLGNAVASSTGCK